MSMILNQRSSNFLIPPIGRYPIIVVRGNLGEINPFYIVTKTCSRLLFKAACEICIFLITATINQIGGISLPEILVESLWPLFRTTADDFQGGGDGMWNPE